MPSPSAYSITPVAAAVTAALYPAYTAVAQESEEHVLDEIIVTATKRAMAVQDIPASIQAITQDSLAAMGAKTMEDYARFVPSVNVVTYGPNASCPSSKIVLP
jgi:outer membrane receptor for ferrienterochelin and colicin